MFPRVNGRVSRLCSGIQHLRGPDRAHQRGWRRREPSLPCSASVARRTPREPKGQLCVLAGTNPHVRYAVSTERKRTVQTVAVRVCSARSALAAGAAPPVVRCTYLHVLKVEPASSPRRPQHHHRRMRPAAQYRAITALPPSAHEVGPNFDSLARLHETRRRLDSRGMRWR